jgi:uncharacterized protein
MDDQRFTRRRLRQRSAKGIRLLWALQLVPALLCAQDPAVRRLFPEQPSNYLTDAAHIVDGETAAAINDLAARLRTATGAELAVVTLPTIEDRDPGDVALSIGRAWGVGARGELGDSARNAGMVLLLVPKTAEHRGEIFLATGRGIEGIVTDARAGRIQDLMLPYLREGRWSEALLLGTRAIAATVAKGYGVSDSVLAAADPFSGGQEGLGINPLLVLFILLVIFIVLSMVARHASRSGRRGRRRRGPGVFWGGPGGGWSGGGGWGSGGWGGGGSGGFGGFGGFGGGGGFSGGGAGRSF